MSYDELLKTRIIEPVSVSNEEIADLLKVARRDIETATRLKNFDLDWAFAIAYNAILQLTLAWMNFLGFRPRGEAKHANTFTFLEETLSKERQPMVERLQKMRKKRNTTSTWVRILSPPDFSIKRKWLVKSKFHKPNWCTHSRILSEH